MSQRARGETDARGSNRVPRADVLLAAITTVGVLMYGLTRLFHDSFYRELSTSVDEVGLDQASLLSSAFVSVARVVVSFSPFLAAALVVSIVSSLWGASRDGIPVGPVLARRSAIALGLGIAGPGLIISLPGAWISLVLLGVIWAWVFKTELRRGWATMSSERFGLREVAGWTLVVAVVLATPFGAMYTGTELGKDAAAGRRTWGIDTFLAQPPYAVKLVDPKDILTTVGADDDPAFAYSCVPSGGDAAQRDDGNELYLMLGEDQGTFVVWNVDRRMVFRVSSDQFAAIRCGRRDR